MDWNDAAELILKGMMPDLPEDVRSKILVQAERLHEFVEAIIDDSEGGYIRRMTVLDLCAKVQVQRLLWEMR